jgi:hypothetical protein
MWLLPRKGYRLPPGNRYLMWYFISCDAISWTLTVVISRQGRSEGFSYCNAKRQFKHMLCSSLKVCFVQCVLPSFLVLGVCGVSCKLAPHHGSPANVQWPLFRKRTKIYYGTLSESTARANTTPTRVAGRIARANSSNRCKFCRYSSPSI